MRKAVFVLLSLLLTVSIAAIPSGTVSATPASSPQPSASSPAQEEDEEALIADILKGLDEIDELTENEDIDSNIAADIRDCTWDAGVYIIRVKLALKKGDSKAARENKWAAYHELDDVFDVDFEDPLTGEVYGMEFPEKWPYEIMSKNLYHMQRKILDLIRIESVEIAAPKKVASPPSQKIITEEATSSRTIWSSVRVCVPKEGGTKTERSAEGTPKETYDNLVGLYRDLWFEPSGTVGPLATESWVDVDVLFEDFEAKLVGDVSMKWEGEQEKSLPSPDLHTLHPAAPIFGYIVLRSRFESEDHTCEGIIGTTIIGLHLSSTAPITIVQSAAEASEYPFDIWGHVIVNLKGIPVQRIPLGGGGGGGC